MNYSDFKKIISDKLLPDEFPTGKDERRIVRIQKYIVYTAGHPKAAEMTYRDFYHELFGAKNGEVWKAVHELRLALYWSTCSPDVQARVSALEDALRLNFEEVKEEGHDL